MSAIAEVSRRIQATGALISEHERALASHPPNVATSIPANIRSLEKLKRRLEVEFTEIAREHELEVYRYRLLEETDRPTLAGVGQVWERFQGLFSAVYAALNNDGAKTKKQADAPDLGYAFAFTGSIGVVATLPKEFQDLSGFSKVEETSSLVFDLIEAKNLKEHAKTLGPKPIEALHSLVRSHVANHFGIGLEWSGGLAARKTEIQYPELVELEQRIEQTTTDTEFQTKGTLMEVSAIKKQFIIIDEDGKEFAVSVDMADIDNAPPVLSQCIATIERRTRIIAHATEAKVTLLLRGLKVVPRS